MRKRSECSGPERAVEQHSGSTAGTLTSRSSVGQGSVRQPARAQWLNAYYEGNELVFVRRENGKLHTKRVSPESSCFIRRDQAPADLLRMLRSSSLVRAVKPDGDWLRIIWCDRDTAEQACVGLHAKGIPTYEGSINPLRRCLADNAIEIARPRRAYLDLETDSRVPFSRKEEMRILIWAVVEEDGAAHSGVLQADSDEAEAELLRQLWQALAPFDQVVAWNGERFDFPVLRARSTLHKVDVHAGRWLWLDHMEVFRRMNSMAAESGDEKQSYALQAIATAVIGEGKDDVDASNSWQMWAAGGQALDKLHRYCIKDTDLMRRIEEHTGYLDLLQTLCEVNGVFADSRGANPGHRVETTLLKAALEHGVHFPTRIGISGDERYRGAFVMEPTERGIVRDVHVADFASLYPSVILSWNMSPETRIEKPEATRAGLPASHAPSYLNHYQLVPPTRPGDVCESAITNVWFKTEPEGLLPAAIRKVLEMRKRWNERKAQQPPGTPEWKDADRHSTVYKVAANSFYGVIGSPLSALFDRQVAESVSQCGVWLIKETIREAEKQGMRVIYGDTDSLFVAGCSRGEFERFVSWCNAELYPRLLPEQGCTRNHVKLAYEKAFDRVVFVSAKRYAGMYAHYKGKAATAESKPEVKGLEYKRGDSVRLARRLQEQIVNLVVVQGCESPAPVEEMARSFQAQVLQGPLELADVVIVKSLAKQLSAYSRTKKKDGVWGRQQPHVEIARVMQQRGQDVGEGIKVRFVCIDGSASPKHYIPAEDFDGNVDRDDLWESLVWPAAERFVAAAFPAHDWKPLRRARAAKRIVRAKPARKPTQGNLEFTRATGGKS